METHLSKADFYVVRLKPGDDLKRSIILLASQHRILAGTMITCVGSLEKVNLRFADKKEGEILAGKFEIISLVGTLSPDAVHLHLSVSDGSGEMKGGHLLDENIVYTTAEIVIADLSGLHFARETDPTYGYKELSIKSRD